MRAKEIIQLVKEGYSIKDALDDIFEESGSNKDNKDDDDEDSDGDEDDDNKKDKSKEERKNLYKEFGELLGEDLEEANSDAFNDKAKGTAHRTVAKKRVAGKGDNKKIQRGYTGGSGRWDAPDFVNYTSGSKLAKALVKGKGSPGKGIQALNFFMNRWGTRPMPKKMEKVCADAEKELGKMLTKEKG